MTTFTKYEQSEQETKKLIEAIEAEQAAWRRDYEQNKEFYLEKAKKVREWYESIKNYFGVPDESDMSFLVKEGTALTGTNWTKLALMCLKAVIEGQETDGQCEPSSDFYEKYPAYGSIGRILAYDGFIRQIDNPPMGAFPLRITTKGLALYSALISLEDEPLNYDNWTDRQKFDLRERNRLKLLAALSGTSF
jgi:hypothetical protein